MNSRKRELIALIDIVEKQIKNIKKEMENLEQKLADKHHFLHSAKKELNSIIKNEDNLFVGDILVFEDEDGFELEVRMVKNKKDNYDGLLMTNYTSIYDNLSEYTLLGYNCMYIDTLVKSIESDYNFKLIDVDR